MRPDAWWAQPLCVFCGLSAFIVYSAWAALQGQHYHWGSYLSPFYSPEIFGESPAQLVWTKARVVARLDAVVPCPAHFVGARRFCLKRYYRGTPFRSVALNLS